MTDYTVHTVNSRDNILLDVLQDHFSLGDEDIGRVIVDAVRTVERALRERSVTYDLLRNALTPQTDRREIALFFDTLRTESGLYGSEVQRRLIPLLHVESTQSVLVGDLLGQNEEQPWIRQQLESHLQPGAAPVNFRNSTQFFCVYLNNCSDEMIRAIDGGLVNYPPYIGLADVTYTSAFKTYLSACLVAGYVKHRRTIIQAHEDDLPDDSNQNTLAYPFEEFGYACKSIAGTYFGLLLSYKIERPLRASDERDRVHSLSSVSASPSDLSNCELTIDDRKYHYLSTEKTGTLQRLGVLGQSKTTLEEMIRAKLHSNYLYSMRFRESCRVSTFNILLELEALDTGVPVRTLASFAYEPERNALRLVTFF